MAGTIEGGRKAAEKNIRLHGEDFYKRIGRQGGQKSTGGGFTKMSKEKLSAAGRKGGLMSRKGSKLETYFLPYEGL